MFAHIKKLTPHNVCVKWPRIVWRKFWYRAIHGPLKRLYFGSRGFHVLRDVYGTKFRYHAWDTTPLNKILPRTNYTEEFAALRTLILPGHTVFDVGANIGLHTVCMSKQVGSHGTVHAFEPVPSTFNELKETLALNNNPNVTAVNSAFSDHRGTQTMHIFDQQYHEWNTFGTPTFAGISPQKTVEVTVQTIDGYCEEHAISHIDFLKIDVEGFETQVLSGACTLLEQKKINYISFEISEIPLHGAGATAQDVFALLADVGYTVYRYNHQHDTFTGPVTLADDFHTNLYASWKPLNT